MTCSSFERNGGGGGAGGVSNGLGLTGPVAEF